MILVEEISPAANGWWLNQPFIESAHVLPLADMTRHELDAGCWCSPEQPRAGAFTHRAILVPSSATGTLG